MPSTGWWLGGEGEQKVERKRERLILTDAFSHLEHETNFLKP